MGLHKRSFASADPLRTYSEEPRLSESSPASQAFPDKLEPRKFAELHKPGRPPQTLGRCPTAIPMRFSQGVSRKATHRTVGIRGFGKRKPANLSRIRLSNVPSATIGE